MSVHSRFLVENLAPVFAFHGRLGLLFECRREYHHRHGYWRGKALVDWYSGDVVMYRFLSLFDFFNICIPGDSKKLITYT